MRCFCIVSCAFRSLFMLKRERVCLLIKNSSQFGSSFFRFLIGKSAEGGRGEDGGGEWEPTTRNQKEQQIESKLQLESSCVYEQNKEKRTNQTLVEPVSQFYVYFLFHLSTLRLPLSLLNHLRVR